ncbi:quinone-dependent dihydroorotate dehydrogenase [Microcoleus sp. PH2017_30_WIL_O_A]|uniref:quinone-dependent dihydroorotate dehydrogenase n=1 Tax=Microcoleus sp. PH2017_30_WIL_O_A TaxID=2798840 RepID=UPI001D8F2792|nr:quinone-dependent dihydroorotate dehydrogenase [Microcoleus sp. PH2017_30_WIL_O_A]MCC3582603.1 quinone-dependent dihydroorotate dehydrogenase [Microcoleus sp. PH2017_30_WIL_O_A]TAE70555.1 MAG: quinone-dependent dihydroorotate dehydrogenase [Oscillatoriales cyanobacterium]
MDIYQLGVRPLLFSVLKTDAEWLHNRTLQVLEIAARTQSNPATSQMLSRLQKSLGVQDSRLEQSKWGLSFKNPVGLAAGFDKNGVAADIWANFGFGFAELGTVTSQAQPGNPQPRLFRLSADSAALNRMGFNNQGAAAMAARFQEAQKKLKLDGSRPMPEPPFPLGINLGKSKVTPLELAAADYLESFKLLKDWGDYFVVNVSSPNTPGLRSLQDAAGLSTILETLQQENRGIKPILVKIAPDLEPEAIASILDLAKTYQLAGIIATNTTIRRDGLKTQILRETGKPISEEAGGISGIPVQERSTEVIRFIWQYTKGELPIIGVGGIFTAEDAWEKIAAGASLIQVYTGWVYEGPWMVRRILAGLLQKLEEKGFNSISEAVGSENIK